MTLIKYYLSLYYIAYLKVIILDTEAIILSDKLESKFIPLKIVALNSKYCKRLSLL